MGRIGGLCPPYKSERAGQRLLLIFQKHGLRGDHAMDYKSLTSLLLRLTGVIMMVTSAIYVPHTFVNLVFRNPWNGDSGVNVETWLLTAVAATFPIVIGLLLIYFPARIANRIVYSGGEAADTPRLEQDAQRLEQIAFSVLGLYFVAMAMFDGVYWYTKLRLYPVIFPDSGPSGHELFLFHDYDFAGIVRTGTVFVAGMALLLGGGRGLANLFRRLRTPPTLTDIAPSMSDGREGQARG
jgi:hypothetical protein